VNGDQWRVKQRARISDRRSLFTDHIPGNSRHGDYAPPSASNYKCPLVNAQPDADFKYDPNCEPLIVSANPASTQYRNVPAQFRSVGCKQWKNWDMRWLAESYLAALSVASLNLSAFAKATTRQSSLFSSTRAKTGGKGIRTPDFQLAKLALYQLSYAPCEFSSLDCGLRIANAMSACVPLIRGFGKRRSRMPILEINIRLLCGSQRAKLRFARYGKRPCFPSLFSTNRYR
jgi:hypothetical protein